MTAACLMTTYQPLALNFTHGLGTRLWDQDGREYLDAVAGVAVTNVGHSHPRLVAAISEQAGLLLHTSNLYSIDWQQRLAQNSPGCPAWSERFSTTRAPRPTKPR